MRPWKASYRNALTRVAERAATEVDCDVMGVTRGEPSVLGTAPRPLDLSQ
jgi:hypothetical protein